MDTKATTGNNDRQNGSGGTPPEPILTCRDFESLLFAYMSRELGDTQSILVREHIRKCESCRAEAVEIERAIALLKSASEAEHSEDSHLTEERRERMLRAALHPVMDWIDQHHKMVSLVLAIVALVVTFFALRDFEIFRKEPLEEGIPIWRMFKSGDLPELVEKRMQETADSRPETGDQRQVAEDSRPETDGDGDE